MPWACCLKEVNNAVAFDVALKRDSLNIDNCNTQNDPFAPDSQTA
jgi:hypothetical protein